MKFFVIILAIVFHVNCQRLPLSSQSFKSWLSSLSSTNGDFTTCKTADKGTGFCTTSFDCNIMKGNKIGNCGDGVCCLVSLNSSTTVKAKAVLLKDSGKDDSLQVFQFPRQPNDCQLRVEFLDTSIEPPSANIFTAGECLSDYIRITGATNVHWTEIKVCGDLRGQHMHLTYEQSAILIESVNGASNRITIEIYVAKATTKFGINVIQLACDDDNRASSICVQDFVGDTGIIKSFGFPRQINRLGYHICTKGLKPGTRSITWEECGENEPNFFITGSVSPDGMLPGPITGEENCITDFIYSQQFNPPGKWCGGHFPKTIDQSFSGHITVRFVDNESGDTFLISELPPSISRCEDVDPYFMFHNCISSVSDPSVCVCSLKRELLINYREISVTELEVCPTMPKFYCARTNETNCACQQSYPDADQENTGFCLKYTHNY